MILGMDPGITGGIAVIDYDGKFVAAMRTPTRLISKGLNVPDLKAIVEFLSINQPERACIEQVHAMPGQGVSSVFTFGVGYGILLCVPQSIRLDLVSPAKWKKFFGLGSDKQESIGLALRLWPTAPIKFKADNGIAEALLIAEYCRREL